MKTRQLGTSGPMLTEIGLGAWAIGGADWAIEPGDLKTIERLLKEGD